MYDSQKAVLEPRVLIELRNFLFPHMPHMTYVSEEEKGGNENHVVQSEILLSSGQLTYDRNGEDYNCTNIPKELAAEP